MKSCHKLCEDLSFYLKNKSYEMPGDYDTEIMKSIQTLNERKSNISGNTANRILRLQSKIDITDANIQIEYKKLCDSISC